MKGSRKVLIAGATIVVALLVVAIFVGGQRTHTGQTLSIDKHYALFELNECEGLTSCWYVFVGGHNYANSTVNIVGLLFNNVTYAGNDMFWDNITVSQPSYDSAHQSGPILNIPVNSGDSYVLLIPLDGPGIPVKPLGFYENQTIQVTLVTSEGNNYTTSLTLPAL